MESFNWQLKITPTFNANYLKSIEASLSLRFSEIESEHDMSLIYSEYFHKFQGKG